MKKFKKIGLPEPVDMIKDLKSVNNQAKSQKKTFEMPTKIGIPPLPLPIKMKKQLNNRSR